MSAISARIRVEEGAVNAQLDLEKALAKLENLDELRAFEVYRVHTEIEHQRMLLEDRGAELSTQRKRRLVDDLQAEMELLDARNELDRRKNPPPKKEPHDSNLDSLRATFSGGGKYTQEVKYWEDLLIKEKGGRQNFTPEEEERVRSAYQHAAELDQSKGRR